MLASIFSPLLLSATLSAASISNATQPDTAALRGARQPATSATGALVFAHDGQLYLQSSHGGVVVRITNGSAWHRDPAWTADGSAIVFASDSLGNYDLWRMPINAAANGGVQSGARARLTSSVAPETAPSVDPDGRVAFVRGSGGATRIWLRNADGAEQRLTNTDQTERAPRLSPDGTRIAWIVINEAGRRVMVRPVGGGAQTTASSDATAESVDWSPDGRLAVSTRSGVYAVATDGSFSALVSKAHGDVDWSADGRYITIAEYSEVVLGYNGDPDRGLDRSATERFTGAAVSAAAVKGDAIIRVLAPAAPDAGRVAAVSSLPEGRAVRNAAAFDRLWERMTRTYFSGAETATRGAQWDAVRTSYRPRALAAANDSVLQQLLYDAQQARPALRADAKGRAAVSSAHPVSTEAGLEIMRRGGNVVDAAVAVSFALGVVEPDASGIGGYGEMVIALKGRAAPTLIEFMSRVPEEGGLNNTSLLVNGRYPSDGPVLVNVPGTVAGMYAAWQKYGSKKLPWADLLAPAIRAARNGYEVSQGLATTLATEREHFAKYDGSRALFFRNGQPMVAGDTVKNPDLAWVLEQIAAKGANGFYKGDVATKWVADLRGKGNAMKLSDLARYFAPEREPIRGTYRDYTIYSSAPPVSGGAELVGRLNLLEQSPAPSRTGKRYTDDPASLHAALSAWFLVPSSRNRIADPAMWPIEVAPIVNKDTARLRWRCFDANKALTPASVRGDTLTCLPKAAAPAAAPAKPADALNADTSRHTAESPCGDEHAAEMTVCHAAGTTAFTVADNDGNAVAVTQTLGTWGGNFYVTPGLGFLSNDKLTSYGTDATQYGSRLPFARHGSTLAPTIAYKNGKPFFAVGAAGNAWITSAVYQTLLGALDYNLGPQAALELPRYLPSGGFGVAPTAAAGTPVPYTLQLENGFSPTVIRRLRALGYDINFVSLPGELREGYGSAVRIDGKVVTAGADPRRAGAAGAIK
ncbi:gamma-glutamyltransferase [Gemmatimonas sp.]|uniref:gamma-glutamyltransferase n=1 Tax=Gemmatimonas sp. TaxID=1962908 RepID=UPI003983944B